MQSLNPNPRPAFHNTGPGGWSVINDPFCLPNIKGERVLVVGFQ